jgi:hypothetical protein
LSVLESLRSRAGVLASGAMSFIVVIGGMRLTGGEPLVQPQMDVGILIGVAVVALFFVISDARGGVRR